jgi:hypothetical protein
LTKTEAKEPDLGLALFKLFASLVMVFFAWYVIVYWAVPSLMSSATTPITDTPQAEWLPVVNARETEGGFVPGVWMAEFPDGTVCYSAYGLLGDDMECVK